MSETSSFRRYWLFVNRYSAARIRMQNWLGRLKLQEWWSLGVLEYWSIGVLEWWSIGVLEYWSIGVVECWTKTRLR